VWLFLVVAGRMTHKGTVVCCCIALLLSFLVVLVVALQIQLPSRNGTKENCPRKKINLRRIRGSFRTELEYNCTSTPAKAPAVNPLMPWKLFY